MSLIRFPVIDPAATGANIARLRQEHGLSVRDLQQYFGFEEPRAIYKWQSGQSLPSVDNLYALSALFGVPMNEILVSSPYSCITPLEQQADACCSGFLSAVVKPLYRHLTGLSLNCWFHGPDPYRTSKKAAGGPGLDPM